MAQDTTCKDSSAGISQNMSDMSKFCWCPPAPLSNMFCTDSDLQRKLVLSHNHNSSTAHTQNSTLKDDGGLFFWLKSSMMKPLSMTQCPGNWCLCEQPVACPRECKLTADWQH